MYKLEQRFSENQEDPTRKKIEENIRRFLSICSISNQTDSYILNGRYLMFRVPKSLEKNVEESISYALCFRGEPPGKPCKRVR